MATVAMYPRDSNGGNKVTRPYIDPPLDLRCRWDIKLRDGSSAQCGRKRVGDFYCAQHTKMLKAQMEELRRKGLLK